LNPKHLYNIEIKRLEKHEIDNSTIKDNYEGICLYPLFDMGWRGFLTNSIICPSDCYKHVETINEQIIEKFKTDEPSLNFFEELAERSICNYGFGMGMSKYYHWLIDELENSLKEPLISKKLIKTGFKSTLSDKKQIQSLFNQLKTGGFISPDTKEYNFLHVFGKPLPDGEVFEHVKWIKKGKNKLVNKSSLIELFQLLDKKLVPDKSFFAFAFENFCTEKESNMLLNHNNISKSKYLNDLTKIIESL